MQEEKQKKIKVFQPGFRFYPTEEELVSFYLHKKLAEKNGPNLDRIIPVINIYEFEPWMLPKLSGELCNGDTEQWFFFVPRHEREARGGRPNRTTSSGYWKATGSPSYVYSSNNKVIGVKKSMVFYGGKAPTGRKTTWKLNEYRIIEEEMPPSSTQAIPKLRHELSLCRVYIISGNFRAFDRRPLGPETNMEISMTRDLAARNADSSYLPSPIADMAERRSSPESCSPGKETGFDPVSVIHQGSTQNWEMAAQRLKSFWD